MSDTKPVQYRTLTPDEVLAELRLFCREWCFTDSDIQKYVRPEAMLSELAGREPEADWGDLISTHGLALPSEKWFAEAPHERTVRDFCEAVTALNEVPVIEPVTVLGTRCETAGAFLTLKRMLANDGADVSELAPTSELRGVVVRHPDVFRRFRLGSGRRLPPISVWNPLGFLGGLLVAAGLVLLLIGLEAVTKTPSIWSIALAGAGLAVGANGMRFVARYRRGDPSGSCVELGELTTFRDLIHTALGRPARAGTA